MPKMKIKYLEGRKYGFDELHHDRIDFVADNVKDKEFSRLCSCISIALGIML